jgi:hypothetical protein
MLVPMASPGGRSDPERLKHAALRLRHDLGKYIRLSAPSRRESRVEALRDRLRSDVLATRSGPDGTFGAAVIFDAWKEEEQEVLPQSGAFAVRLGAIARNIDIVRALAPHLDRLGREELERLDRATGEIARDCRRLCEDADE